jgi:hypothetical protein
VGRPNAVNLLDMAFWKTVPDSCQRSVYVCNTQGESTYCDANRHTETAEEPIHTSSHSTIFDLGDSLDADVDTCQDHARTNTEDGESHIDDYYSSVKIKEDEEAASSCCNSPAEPDRPSKTSKTSRQDSDNDGARNKETDSGKDIDACPCWGLSTNRHEEEWNIVQSCEELDDVSTC